MKIGELARRTGASVRALRYYEQQGLLRPERRPSGYREFRTNDIALVERIQNLISAGLNTTLIAQILDCFDDGGAGHTPTPTCAEMVADLTAARDRMHRQVESLTASSALLEAIIKAAPTADGRSTSA